MAAFAQASRAPTPSRARQSRPPTLPRSPSSHDKTLPFGSCNSRDHSIFGAPTCGCKRFWRNLNRPEDGGDGDSEYPWCICGHHACFHDAPGNAASSSHDQSIRLAPNSPVDLVQVSDGVYVDRTRLDHTTHDIHHTPRRRGKFTRSLSGDTTGDNGEHAIHDLAVAGARPANPTSLSRGDNSDLHLSGFPSVPSICCYPGTRHDPDANRHVNNQPPQQPPTFNMPMQSTTDCLDHTRGAETDALHEWHKTLERAREQSHLASTVRYSTDTESDRPRNSPSRAFLDHVLQSRRAAAQTDALPTVVKREDPTQSVMDLATSTVADTQDVQTYDRHLQETTSMIDDVVRDIASVENADVVPTEQNELVLSPTQPNTSQRSSRHAGDGTPDPRTDSVASVPMSVPWALRKLAPQLLNLKRHLAAQPNISTTIQNMSDRLWMLENTSFQHVPAEEICDKFDLVDGRLLDVEHRLVGIERLREESQTSVARRDATEDPSFYGEFSEKFFQIEQRLRDLEQSVPSTAYPWEVEVVLLPWGRDLRGIWFSPSELPGMSLSFEDLRSTRDSISPLRIKGTEHGGSSDNEDSDHGDLNYEKLYPKACGPRSTIWRRLKSRGFIKNVAITEPGARHILTTIHDAFGQDVLKAAGDCSHLKEHELEILGMRAPVLPLRKIPKDKQLQFLPPSETISPTLWNAEFLSADVIHHVRGKKRLYVTGSCAYMQEVAAERGSIWSDIRSLPKVNISSSAAEEAQAPEADYDEPWWEYHPNFDPPFETVSSRNTSDNSDAAHSSFNSSASAPLAYRNAPDTPSNSEPVDLYPRQKEWGTPQSDVTPRPPRALNRTVSAPTTQVPITNLSYKRRHTEDVPLSPYVAAEKRWTAPDYRRKRRRTSRSSAEGRSNDSDADSASGDARDGFCGHTPRQSIEPSVPFVPYLEREGRFGFPARSPNPVSQAPPSPAKGSDAYATPFSGTSGTANGPPPDQDPPRYEDTEPDEVESDGGDEKDKIRGNYDNNNNKNNVQRVGHYEWRYEKRDGKRMDGDNEMTDSHSEWQAGSQSSVDYVKRPESPVKRKDGIQGQNPWVTPVPGYQQ